MADVIDVKRRLLTIAGLLAAGAALSVAVAWTSALTLDVSHGRLTELYTELGQEHHWEIYRWDNAPGTRVFSRTWYGFAPGPYNNGDPADLLASWGRTVPPDPDTPEVVSYIDEAWGFPFRSVACRTVSRPTPEGRHTTVSSHVLRLTKPRRPGGSSLYLPLRPVWGGLAVNSLLYALLVLVIYAVARDIRRAIRRRRDIVAA